VKPDATLCRKGQSMTEERSEMIIRLLTIRQGSKEGVRHADVYGGKTKTSIMTMIVKKEDTDRPDSTLRPANPTTAKPGNSRE